MLKINTGRDCNGNVAVSYSDNNFAYVHPEIAKEIVELKDELKWTKNHLELFRKANKDLEKERDKIASDYGNLFVQSKDTISRRNALITDLRGQINTLKEQIFNQRVLIDKLER